MTKIEILRSLLAAFLFFGAGYGGNYWTSVYGPGQIANVSNLRMPSTDVRAAPECNSFPTSIYLEEAPSPLESASRCWWVNSGAIFVVDNGLARTASGPIYQLKKWQELYAADDPVDTDGGWYPQNIFRLINSSSNLNTKQEVYFNVERYRLSESPNRNMTNGVFVFTRYIDSQNLYLAGLRVDGTAVIKRKLNGIYQTLATVPFANSSLYDSKINPNLLPTGKWIGMALESKNNSDGTVGIKFTVDLNDGKGWRVMLETTDNPAAISHGTTLLKPGRGGIRTDFLDINFKHYKLQAL